MLKTIFLFICVFCSIMLHCASEISIERSKTEKQAWRAAKPMGRYLDQRLKEADFEPIPQDITCLKKIAAAAKEFSNRFMSEEEKTTTPTTCLGFIATLYDPDYSDEDLPKIFALAQAYVEQETPLTQDELDNARNCLPTNSEENTGFSTIFLGSLGDFKLLIAMLEKEQSTDV